jgi:hypothetical protein
MFADDIATVSLNKREAEISLGVMQSAADSVAVTWAPEKCVYLARSETDLKLCGEKLPFSKDFKYLGVWIKSNGINTAQQVKYMCGNTAKSVGRLKGAGINSYGPTPDILIKAYKTFVRPCLEYSLGILLLSKTHLKALEGAQAGALKKLLGVPRSTASDAVLTLCNVEPMEVRWRKLTARYVMSRLNVQKDHPIWWVKQASIQSSDKIHWKRLQEKYIDNQSKPPSLDGLNETKAGQRLERLDKPHPVLHAPKKMRWILINAALGNIPSPYATCTKCGAGKGRQHIFECLDIHKRYDMPSELDPLESFFKRMGRDETTEEELINAYGIAFEIWVKCMGGEIPSEEPSG